MTMLGEYMEIERLPHVAGRKTSSWIVRNARSGVTLGEVAWSGAWRQYVFSPTEDETIFSAGCLRDLASFLDSVRNRRETR